jgi:hypothetical protein
MMMVRIKVAKSELTLSIPTFANMAVSAANAAEPMAQNCQDRRSGLVPVYLCRYAQGQIGEPCCAGSMTDYLA